MIFFCFSPQNAESFDGENLDALEEMLLDYTSMERTLKQFTAAVSEVKSQVHIFKVIEFHVQV